MPSQEEIERIKRIQQAQLRARDPQAKNRQMSKQIAARQKSHKQNKSLGADIKSSLNHAVKGGLWGFIIGLTVKIALPFFLEFAWVNIVGIAAIILFTALGAFIGSSFDWRDTMRNF